MSVAFRRDGDDEHREPRFELPIPPGPNLVTARGLALIQARVVALEAEVALTGQAGGGDAAAGHGTALGTLRRDLRYWRTRLATAQPTAPPADGSAGFGTRVTLRLAGVERIIDIVGDDEAAPAQDRIAWSAPLARALAGAEPGERLDFAGRAEAIVLVAVAAIPAA